MKDHQKALADLTEAIRLDPKYQDACLDRARVYWTLGEEALALTDKDQVANMERNIKCACQYSFVWKPGTTKKQVKLGEKIANELPLFLEKAGAGIAVPRQINLQGLRKLRKKLYAKKEETGTKFVYGKGHGKSELQKAIGTINSWLERLKRYNLDIHICGDRNSYSKTDHDATIMYMKEDHMAYNIQKLHHKIQNGRLGTHLIIPRAT